MKRWLTMLAGCCLTAVAAFAESELRLEYPALERILAKQAFTQEGRLYLRGDLKARCSYAYFREPQVGSEGGKLKIRARFSGRSAINLFGQCVGLGDSFNLTILSVPYFRDGRVRLRDVSVACEGNGVYVRAACLAIGRSLERDFRHDLGAAARRLIDEEASTSSPLYKRQVESFDVTDVRVTPDAVVLLFRVRMVVK